MKEVVFRQKGKIKRIDGIDIPDGFLYEAGIAPDIRAIDLTAFSVIEKSGRAAREAREENTPSNCIVLGTWERRTGFGSFFDWGKNVDPRRAKPAKFSGEIEREALAYHREVNKKIVTEAQGRGWIAVPDTRGPGMIVKNGKMFARVTSVEEMDTVEFEHFTIFN